MAFSGRVMFQLAAELTSPLDLTTPTAKLDQARQILLAEGTGLNQANKLWSDTRTLAASATEDIDLNGVLAPPVGSGTVDITKLKGLFVAASSANTNNVVIGNQATNGIVAFFGANTHSIAVKPGGFLALFAPDANGYTITATSADLLKVANSAAGTPVTYDIVVIGA